MENFIQQSISEQSATLHNDLWNAISDMFEKDGIDYMNEKDVIRVVTSTEGDSLLCYKGKPYCVWSAPKIEMGLSDSLNRTVRATIELKKI